MAKTRATDGSKDRRRKTLDRDESAATTAAPPPEHERAPKLDAQARDLRTFFLDHAEKIAPLLKDENHIEFVMELLVAAVNVALDTRIARAEELLRKDGRKPTRSELARLQTATHYAFEEIAQAAKEVGDAFYEDDDLDEERYPPEQALPDAPPPYTNMRKLSVGDARRIIEGAAAIAPGSKFTESQIALFLQAVLPYFKAAATPTVLISSAVWSSAAHFACGKRDKRERLFEACARIVTRVHGTGHFGGKWYPAQYALVPGAFVFDDVTPETPLPSEDRASHQARWLALSALAAGDVPTAAPKRSKRSVALREA